MTNAQKSFIANMTVPQAQALINKFGGNPARAEAKSDAAIHAFRVAWEVVSPREYWQRFSSAGEVRWNLISM